MPKISIIVPVYKVEKYIHRCVDSILAQTFTDFELILVDDGSPDNCGKICDEYAKKDSRICVIHQENKGVSAARNAGIDIAQGEYIGFIDSDDFIDNDYLYTFWSNKSDLTLSGFPTYDEDGKKLYSRIYKDIEYTSAEEIDYVYLCDKLFSPYCRLFRRNILEQFHIRFPVEITWGEDGVFAADYVQHIRNAKVLSYGGYHYINYKEANSLSTRVRDDIIEMITTSREYYLHRIESLAGENGDRVREIILNDLRKNCVYFVITLFRSPALSRVEKNRILNSFLENPHVKATMKTTEQLYWDKDVRISLQKKDPIKFYEYLVQKRHLFNYIYTHCYMKLPQCFRNYIRKRRRQKKQ